MYKFYIGIFAVGIVKASSRCFSSGVMNSRMKSAKACPLIVGRGVNSKSN